MGQGPRTRRATLQTVADEVGVSRTTVSNAYSRPDQLHRDLRERILEAARRLGYAGPDAAARSLRRGKAGAIGLLFTETLSYAFADPYSVGFLRGVAEVAESHGSGLLLIPLRPGDEDSESTVRDAVVDGFCLYCVSLGHPAQQVIEARGLPFVTTGNPGDREIPYVGIDECASARMAAEHLVRLGHRRFGVIIDVAKSAGPGRSSLAEQLGQAHADLRSRLEGYREVLEEIGVDWARVPVVAAGRNDRALAARAASDLLDIANRPTAVLAVTDVLALGVLDAIEQRGLAVGREVSVVGFDDVPEAARARLTTVHQPMEERGRIVGRLLLEPPPAALDGKAPHIVLPTELVVRATTGPAPR